jgi:hypothetical protein
MVGRFISDFDIALCARPTCDKERHARDVKHLLGSGSTALLSRIATKKNVSPLADYPVVTLGVALPAL